MKQKGKWWLPDVDKHFVKGAKLGVPYQGKVVNAALRHVKKYDLAVDIGAHVGLLTRQILKKFPVVHAFEPEPLNFECLKLNVPTAICWNVAIGAKHGSGKLVNPQPLNTGAWTLVLENGNIPVQPLDFYQLEPDFVKIDVQGETLPALIGAEKTLRNRPVIAMEVMNKGKIDDASIRHLERLGAVVFEWVNEKDVIMGWA